MDSFQGEVPAQSWRGLIISDGSSFISQGDEGKERGQVLICNIF